MQNYINKLGQNDKKYREQQNQTDQCCDEDFIDRISKHVR